MSAARPQFSIDDAFELSLEDAGPGPESSGVTRFGPLHFERRARFEVAEEDKQSRLRYQNLENDEDGAQPSSEPDGGVSTRDSVQTSIGSSQWSFSTISNSTQRSYRACCSWTQHPLIQKNRRVVLASFLLLLLGLGPGTQQVLHNVCWLTQRPHQGADRNLSFHRHFPGPASCPALKTQSLVSPAPSSSCPASCCWSRECTTWCSSTAPSRATGASSSSICPTSRSEPPADGLHPASPPSGFCGLLASPGGAPRARAPLFPSSQGKSPFRTLEPLAPLGVCSGSLGLLGLGKCPSPALCLNLFSGLGAAGLVVVCANKRGT
uniref:Transmembrane protein 134 n=1 Tax=Equus caballus TaxID=9796 RepID=A0A3Q2H0Z5_HORSE